MGANCCKGGGSVDSVQDSVMTLADLEVQASDPAEMTVEEARDDAGPSEQRPPSPTLRPSEITISDCDHPRSQEGTSNTRESPRNLGQDGMSLGYTASNILWSTGSFSDPILNGFYSVIPDKRLKLCKSMPTLDEIHALGDERLMDDVILIDFERDLKFCRLKDYTITLVKGLESKPVTVIKKIAGLLADIYKRPTLQNPAITTKSLESRGFPLLGQIKHGSCRSRAIFFKALADHVGLKSRLVMGFPSDRRSPASVDSYNHMSVVVVLNTVEMLVDLMRCPGQLIPFSPKAIYMAHISGAGQTNYDSFDSPLESNSFMQGNASPSQNEPNTATESWRRKLIQEQCTASSSCKSDGAAKHENKGRRRSHMKTPEISDDIARAVLVMKQTHFLKVRGGDDSSPHSPDDKNISGFHLDSHDQVSGGRVTVDPQEAISLLSSPQNHQSQSYESSGPSNQNVSRIWDEVLESPMFQNKPLLPYKEWNIDFSELTVGSRIGSGSFGIVFQGMWNGTDVAIKMLLEKQLTAENMEDFCNEMSILSQLRHPNVVLFLGACTKPPQLSVVTEYMERGSLYELLHTRQQEIKWQRKLQMLREICRGLMYIHRMGVVHCDLKSANCLLGKKWLVKICDFGLSRMMKGKTVKDAEAAGTPEWMAPELIRNEPFSEKCDIFSFGVIMWELCTLSKPWEGVPKEKVIYTVANEGDRLKIPEGPLSTLIADCWSEPEQRPTCKEILHRLMICELIL